MIPLARDMGEGRHLQLVWLNFIVRGAQAPQPSQSNSVLAKVCMYVLAEKCSVYVKHFSERVSLT